MTATATRKRQATLCKVCAHPEGAFISRCLAEGQSPRQAARRYSQLTRRALTRHRDTCLKEAPRE